MCNKLQALKSPILAGFGNPLLDMYLYYVKPEVSFYKTYNLKSDGQKEISASEFQSIYDYFKNRKYQFEYRAGGCVQNTLRVFQRIIKKPYSSVIFGGIGNDEKGAMLQKMVEHDGVITKYGNVEGQSTGRCIAIVNGVDRSLVANLGAANVYTVGDFLKAENVELFTRIQVAYVEGFFLTHSFPVAVEVVRLCRTNGVAMVFNISGVYLLDHHFKAVMEMVMAADLIIGNADEYRALWKCYDAERSGLSVDAILAELQSVRLPVKMDVELRSPVFRGNKILISTQASDLVVCVHGDKEVLKVPPDRVDPTFIKDTTGAGDSFVGGLLVGLLRNRNLQESIRVACWAAAQVIQQVGCTLPATVQPPYELTCNEFT